MIGFFTKLFKNLKPRYHLALDKKIYDKKSKEFIYRFKIFGIHSFAKYTFNDIEKDESIAYEINPYDLMEITINEYKHKKQLKLFKVVESLRDNQYKIANTETEEIINGEDLLYDPFLIKKSKETIFEIYVTKRACCKEEISLKKFHQIINLQNLLS